MAVNVHLDYEQCRAISAGFHTDRGDIDQLYRQLKNSVEQLHNGGWVGEAADRWYNVMEGELLPAVLRLSNAQGSIGDSTQKVLLIIQQADEGCKSIFSNVLAGKSF